MSAEATMKSTVQKRSIVINGHTTSVSLEDAFWNALKEAARANQTSVSIQGARPPQPIFGHSVVRPPILPIANPAARRRPGCRLSVVSDPQAVARSTDKLDDA
jgi:hypothetical protein